MEIFVLGLRDRHLLNGEPGQLKERSTEHSFIHSPILIRKQQDLAVLA